MRRHLRLTILLCLLIGAFLLGRQSARGAAQRIPLSTDQFLAAMGVAHAALEVAEESHNRILSITTDRFRGQYTQAEADTLIHGLIAQRNERIASAILSFMGMNVEKEDRFIVPPAELPSDIQQMIEILSVRYPTLSGQYLK